MSSCPGKAGVSAYIRAPSGAAAGKDGVLVAAAAREAGAEDAGHCGIQIQLLGVFSVFLCTAKPYYRY